MSSTRHAAPGSPLRQERWASSIAIDRGIKSNLVALRLKGDLPMTARESIWLTQALSLRPPGLARVVQDLLTLYPERVTTRTLHRQGARPEAALDASAVRKVRTDLPGELRGEFALQGETSFQITCSDSEAALCYEPSTEETARARTNPTGYAVSAFKDCCERHSRTELAAHLTELCLNPDAGSTADPWYFQGLLDALRDYVEVHAQRQPEGIAATSIVEAVEAACTRAARTGGITIIEGPRGLGKSWGAKALAARRPGRFRLCPVASTNDRLAFFRPIAESLGTPACTKAKAQEIQMRVEQTLRAGDLVPVFDDALHLWPNTNLREAMPDRVDWITSLAESGVPVVLITTANFWERMKAIEGRGAWSPERFLSRTRKITLPEALPFADFEAVTRAQLPDAERETVLYLAGRAFSYPVRGRDLHTLARMIRDARYVAEENGRDCPTVADAVAALGQITEPADQALARSVKASLKIDLAPQRGTLAVSPQSLGSAAAKSLPGGCGPSAAITQGRRSAAAKASPGRRETVPTSFEPEPSEMGEAVHRT